MKHTNTFLADEGGLETVEYAIIAGLVVSGIAVVIMAIGAWVKSAFTNLQRDLGTSAGGR